MAKPPENFHDVLKALWWERKNSWDIAHKIVMHLQGDDAAWVHAYLHRKEEDPDNALFWYKKANKEFPEMSITDEFREITKVFLEKYA
ncbi:MAG: hypothetical protein KAS71_06575, partial [Bacteroidales bacterium]|nr:hypothetical protein [Bacteroidales bacterium]